LYITPAPEVDSGAACYAQRISMTDPAPPGRDPLDASGVTRLVVFAPNWLGDAVMALPALTDVLRANDRVAVTVAARPPVAPLFELVPGVSAIVTVDPPGPAWRDGKGPLRDGRFGAALLLPNSFHAAFVARRCGIPERWGYATDFRRLLLTRAIAPPCGLHQAAFYQHLTRALGFGAGPLVPVIDLPADRRSRGEALLRESGWNGRAPLVAFAPGAAYGGAKKWPAASFAAVASALWDDGLVPVIVGSAADAVAADELASHLRDDVRPIKLAGRTTLPMLAAVLSLCRALVSNDSGAMHLAAALGVPVTALFGPTDETATHPIGRSPHVVLTHAVWCRPCMLRECPLGHRCLRGIDPQAVTDTVRQML
jgi:heptosyltransferase-2